MAIHKLDRELPQVRPVNLSMRQFKYLTDPSYRDKAKRMSRGAYRRKMGMETKTCLYSLAFLDQIAQDYSVVIARKKQVIKGFSVPRTADALQQLYQTVWRWLQNGVIPAPKLHCFGQAGPRISFPVYHIDEVRVLVEEIGEHERTMAYLRKDHFPVRERIERRILTVRQALNII